MNISPEQYIYNICRKAAALVLGESNTYDYIPRGDADYPFFYLGDVQRVDSRNKSVIVPTIHVMVHYYNNDYKNRGDAAATIEEYKQRLYRRTNKKDKYNANLVSVSSQLLFDNTTETTLLHGIISIEFKIL